MKAMSRTIAIATLVLGSGLQAQTVYRCGNSYSQTPCPGGSTLDATDARTAEQRKAHEANVKHEKRTGDALEKIRLKEEAAARKAAQQADQAQRDAEKAAVKKSPAKSSKEKLPAYRSLEKQ